MKFTKGFYGASDVGAAIQGLLIVLEVGVRHRTGREVGAKPSHDVAQATPIDLGSRHEAPRKRLGRLQGRRYEDRGDAPTQFNRKPHQVHVLVGLGQARPFPVREHFEEEELSPGFAPAFALCAWISPASSIASIAASRSCGALPTASSGDADRCDPACPRRRRACAAMTRGG